MNGVKGFTLVELIVGVGIVIILSSIGIISFFGNTSDARDATRFIDMNSMNDGLKSYKLKNISLPDPFASVEIRDGSLVVSYQGYIDDNVLDDIGIGETKDPLTNEFYTYYLNSKKTDYQLLFFLESEDLSFLNQTHAGDYSESFPRVVGDNLGVLIDSDNSPIQQIQTIIDDGYLDISGTSDTYSAIFNSENVITGTGADFTNIRNLIINKGFEKGINEDNVTYKSCLDILNNKPETLNQDGIYSISPSKTVSFDVWCDMTFDGGGWTYATVLADSTSTNLFKTGNSGNVSDISSPNSTKGRILDVWKDYLDKDIMLVCNIDDSNFSNYQIPLVLEDFKKNDLINLEKGIKNGTKFSSNSINASWNGNNYLLDTTYPADIFDSDPENFFLRDSNTNEAIFLLRNGNNIALWESCKVGSPCESSIYRSTTLSGTKYCMTAIR